MTAPDADRRRYTRTRTIVAVFLLLETAALVGGEASGARYARWLWPFNDAAMFTTDLQDGRFCETELLLADGAAVTPLSMSEAIHPHLDVGQWALEFRIERTPMRWDDSFDRGLAGAVNRFRCTRGLRADAAVIARDCQSRAVRLEHAPFTSRELIRRIPLPPCP